MCAGTRERLRNVINVGPISDATSLHVRAALRECDMLEMQFDESSLFDALCGGVLVWGAVARAAGNATLVRAKPYAR
jgi:hypothetical protein